MSAGFLQLVGAVAGGRPSGRLCGLSAVSVDSAAPLTGHRRSAVSQERQSTAHGTNAERRVR
ncbi:hypothetical protein GCM10010313_83010 [Streptomyces violarus]|uniref:Uncharacterized protein n=1 Tax=Streptomyces violarus TaxID=67380 RepID=A0A7W5F6D4_9ACTN|nr:hypothetical protein [Streptomyces violarus]GHD35557.1 hypothetical protein GCM10010313_83010 [Streptomyces violarus]